MLDRLSYFITIAEELNITKAAQSLFVSQQCLSAYLKDLEEELGTQLFFRKPQFKLTPAGEIYYNMARQIQLIQNDTTLQLRNATYESEGELLIGVHPSRSVEFMPDILERFWNEFPNVRISLVDGTTESFERQLQNYETDMYIGINPRNGKDIDQVLLLDEQVYICISDEVLRKYFYHDYPKCLERFDQGVHLEEFAHVPFIFNYSKSNVYISFQAYLTKKGVSMNRLLGANNAVIRIDMTVRGFGACIANSMRKPYVAKLNSTLPSTKKLFLFPIVNSLIPSQIYLVWRKSLYYPRFQERFRAIVQEYFAENYDQ